MKNISIKTLVVLCVVALVIPVVAGFGILAVSNTINVTVTDIPYSTSLTINGTSTVQYSGAVHPGDKLVLVATSTPVFASGKTIIFYNNVAYQIGTQTANSNGVATLTWTVPALTSGGIISGSDVYAFRAELT